MIASEHYLNAIVPLLPVENTRTGNFPCDLLSQRHTKETLHKRPSELSIICLGDNTDIYTSQKTKL